MQVRTAWLVSATDLGARAGRYKLLKPKIVSPLETASKAQEMADFSSVLYHEPSIVAEGAKAEGLTAAIDEELKLSKNDMLLLSNSARPLPLRPCLDGRTHSWRTHAQAARARRRPPVRRACARSSPPRRS